MSYTTPHWLRWKTRTAYGALHTNPEVSESPFFILSTARNTFNKSVFLNKIEPFSFQSAQELVLEFGIVTADTRALRGKGEKTRIVVCWLLSVPATSQCISGTDLLRQFYVLPHWDRSCRSNFPSHPVTVYWHRANQSKHWPCNARHLAG